MTLHTRIKVELFVSNVVIMIAIAGVLPAHYHHMSASRGAGARVWTSTGGSRGARSNGGLGYQEPCCVEQVPHQTVLNVLV